MGKNLIEIELQEVHSIASAFGDIAASQDDNGSFRCLLAIKRQFVKQYNEN